MNTFDKNNFIRSYKEGMGQSREIIEGFSDMPEFLDIAIKDTENRIERIKQNNEYEELNDFVIQELNELLQYAKSLKKE
jgi:hypothetical protein